jgi:hypothetical protein
MSHTNDTPVNLQPVREALLRDAALGSDSAAIDMVLDRLLNERFAQVRVQTFVPIFLYRAAQEELRANGGRGQAC